MDCSPPDSSLHGVLQARILKRIAISYSRGSSRPRDRTHISHTEGRFFTVWATREAQDCLYSDLIIQFTHFPAFSPLASHFLLFPSPFSLPAEDRAFPGRALSSACVLSALEAHTSFKPVSVPWNSCNPSCLWSNLQLELWNWFRAYLYGLVVFPTFFNLSLNFAITRSQSEPQSAPGLVFTDYIEFLHLWLQRI